MGSNADLLAPQAKSVSITPLPLHTCNIKLDSIWLMKLFFLSILVLLTFSIILKHYTSAPTSFGAHGFAPALGGTIPETWWDVFPSHCLCRPLTWPGRLGGARCWSAALCGGRFIVLEVLLQRSKRVFVRTLRGPMVSLTYTAWHQLLTLDFRQGVFFLFHLFLE